jgi:hypothetical protein
MSNAIQPPYDQAITPQNTNQFDLLGHPGKFHASVVATGSQWFTGSNYGVGAVLVGTDATGLIHLSNGGAISASVLAVGYIHELSVKKIDNASNIYVLIRNQSIR